MTLTRLIMHDVRFISASFIMALLIALAWSLYASRDRALIQTTEAHNSAVEVAETFEQPEVEEDSGALGDQEELRCLALNVYHESRSEPLVAQIAVASVTLNRVRAERFPATICGVVKHSRKAGTCQFSWYCDGKSDTPFEKEAWANSLAVAQFAIDHFNTDFVDGAKYFYSGAERPSWAARYKAVATIGNITFMKRPDAK